MKTIKLKAILVSIIIANFGVTQCTEINANADALADGLFNTELTAGDTISDEVKEAIIFMREEEKLARDVYLTLYEKYPLRPFLNISKSEQVHMDAMLYLINLYNIEDPVKDNEIGAFENSDLQSLYKELISRGSESKTEALMVGALIEEIDILDLEEALLDAGPNEELNRVYTNLCKASKNHLRAFVRVLSVNGVTYEPVKLDKNSYASIVGN